MVAATLAQRALRNDIAVLLIRDSDRSLCVASTSVLGPGCRHAASTCSNRYKEVQVRDGTIAHIISGRVC